MPSDALLPIGRCQLPLGGAHLGELVDSSPLLGDAAALRERLAEDGCLLLRGLHERALVLTARRQMLAILASEGRLGPSAPLDEGRIAPAGKGGFRGGRNALTACPAFLELVGAGRIMPFFAHLLGAPVITFDHQWLRVVGHGETTNAHMDVVYMGRGTHAVHTCWTPLGDIPLALGPLAVCLGSHRLPGWQKVRDTYGRMDVDRDRVQGWFSDDPVDLVERFGGRWATAEFRAGDALIFGMFAMHMSLVNTSDRFRLTADTRYQLADAPVDERWVGAQPKGHYGWHAGPPVSMEEARRAWGV